MATEQLDDALKLYFQGRYHSAIVLAGASEELLAGYVMKHGMTPSYPRMRKNITSIANGLKEQDGSPGKVTREKDIGNLMNRAYNSSKHASASDHSVQIEPKTESQYVIDRAISNFDALSSIKDYDLPVLEMAQQFMIESASEVHIEDIN